MFGTRTLAETDPEIRQAIDAEARRQNDGLELIASENFASAAVLEAAGSVLTNKYAEGYPGRRYYGGCEFVDVAERLARRAGQGAVRRRARQRAAALRQPGQHGGLLRRPRARRHAAGHGPRSCGGHLTHGHPLSTSRARLTTSSPTASTGTARRIDYDEVRAAGAASTGPS